MTHNVRRAQPMAVALLALAGVAGLLSACVDHDPRTDPDVDPDNTPQPTAVVAATSASVTPVATAIPTTAPTIAPTPAATATPASSIDVAHVALTVATNNAVTIDVKDSSGTLVRATSGTPGDGATVEPYALIVKNVSPTTIRLTWTGGPCDSANQLFVDNVRKQLLLVQPGCSGDAIATDRVLDLTFSTPIKASTLDAYLQDGLDT